MVIQILFCITASPTLAQDSNLKGKEKSVKTDINPNDSISLNHNIVFTVKPFDLKLEEPSVGVQFYRDGYIYLMDTKNQNKDLGASFGILDTYYQPLESNKTNKPFYFSPDFAFPYPTESVTFTAGYKTMYFTKTAKPLNSKSPVKIFESQSVQTKKGNGWSEKFLELSFNGKDYSCLEPSISDDGSLMIFASDMPGGFGKYDLYEVSKKGNSWGIPVNLGSKINSSGNENYPFLTENGILYFASEGHKGYGGYDIFYSKYDAKGWSPSINLGQGVNSSGNDIAFKQSKENKDIAFFSSTRKYYRNRYQLFSAILKSGKQQLIGEKVNGPGNIQAQIQKSNKTEETSIRNSTEKQDELSNNIVFRVQLSTTKAASKLTNYTVANKKYAIFEYYYKGAYRQTIGEFSTTSEAYKLVRACRSNKFKDAFVVTMQGKIRILNKNVLKTTKQTIPKVNKSPEEKIYPTTEIKKEEINYRVQIASSSKPIANLKVIIDGTTYSAFEYKYKGIYRYTIGNFSQISKARELQAKCKKTKYNQAFVVKFKGDSRL